MSDGTTYLCLLYESVEAGGEMELCHVKATEPYKDKACRRSRWFYRSNNYLTQNWSTLWKHVFMK